MSNTSTVDILVSVTSPGGSSPYHPTNQLPEVNPNAPEPAVPQAFNLVAGNNTVNIPDNCQSVIFYPAVVVPGPNTNAKTIGGLAINPALTFKWSPVAGTGRTVVVNVAANEQMLIAFC